MISFIIVFTLFISIINKNLDIVTFRNKSFEGFAKHHMVPRIAVHTLFHIANLHSK